jgi:hypothetical protein
MIGIDHHLVARQVRWQGTVLARHPAGARFWLAAADCHGGIQPGLMIGDGLLMI